MKLAGVREKPDAENRVRWRPMIRCAAPEREQPKGAGVEVLYFSVLSENSAFQS